MQVPIIAFIVYSDFTLSKEETYIKKEVPEIK